MFIKAFLPVLGLLFVAGAVGAAPRVVASIGPVHSLVAGVMRGVGAPDLLVARGGSPHDQTLRPSQARLLRAAELIVWVGPVMESFLDKPIRSLGSNARLITLMKAPGIVLLPIRDALGESRVASGARPINPHIWLGPDNAIAIVARVAATLSELDSANAGLYRRNAAALARRIEALAAEIETTLAAVKTRPYVVLHDAYRYYEERFGLNVVGSIMASSARQPGARRLSEVRRRILSRRVACAFGEPQESSALLRSVVKGTPARTGMLDPLGVDLPAGPDAYFGLMRAIATSLVDCLSERN